MTTHYNANGSVDKWDRTDGKKITYQFADSHTANKQSKGCAIVSFAAVVIVIIVAMVVLF